MPFALDRRRALKLGLSATVSFGTSRMFGATSSAVAQEVKPLSFQLSWIKSIQYGGFFAGVDQGFFKKFNVDATFVSGGPNVDRTSSSPSCLLCMRASSCASSANSSIREKSGPGA